MTYGVGYRAYYAMCKLAGVEVKLMRTTIQKAEGTPLLIDSVTKSSADFSHGVCPNLCDEIRKEGTAFSKAIKSPYNSDRLPPRRARKAKNG